MLTKRRGITLVLAVLITVVTVWTLSTPPAGAEGNGSRTWKISYNGALSLHEAAVPTRWAKPGTDLKITYKNKTLKVHAISGGCSCFDISDEGMNRLASTSVGVIKAEVTRL